MSAQNGIEGTEPVESQPEALGGEIEADEEAIDSRAVCRVQVEGNASLTDTLAGAVIAGQSASLTDSLSTAVVAGAGVEMKDSACTVMVAGGDVNLQEGGAGFIHCQQAAIENSTVGILVAPRATLGQDVKVMMTTRQAIAFGAAFGLAAGIIGILFRRKR